MYVNLYLVDICVEQEQLPFTFKLYVTRLRDGYEVIWGKWRLTLSKK